LPLWHFVQENIMYYPYLISIVIRRSSAAVVFLGATFDQVGSHARYIHPDGRRTVVPLHENE